ncbi:DUF1077-domain-containing protein [Cystobasidium minutum MCA 4210]|uniref:DUF1077-domain-containing protein n=1 Tax=Cystobasidium minutum MCA 4210 TaxID=1397322 RepID=UPI0034CDC620|eukprot:jgi/Rhomi1/161593/estExt_Genewise1Plus.C_5_t10049
MSSHWLLPPAPLAGPSDLKGIEAPPGFASYSRSKASSTTASSSHPAAIAKKQSSLEMLRTQKAWDLAISPAKAVPMQGFMVYMSGGGVQIFSLMIVYQLIKGAITGMMGVNNVFEHLEQTSAASTPEGTNAPIKAPNFTLQKIVHCLAQCLLLALGLYKCHTMGLLPTHESDWLAFSKQRIPIETSSISLNGWWKQ